MSYTLKKLKQSEIDQGYRVPAAPKKSKPSYGIFIACFVLILSFILVFLNQGKDFFSKQQASPSEIIDSSIKNIPPINTSSTQLMNELSGEDDPEVAEKPKLIGQKHETVTSLQQTTIYADANTELANKSVPKDQSMDDFETIQFSENTIENEDLNHLQNAAGKIEQQDSPTIKINSLQSTDPDPLQGFSDNTRSFLSEMDINVIAYLKKEEDRYIILNMRKYRLNDFVIETGYSIEEIKKNSVVLRDQNGRVTLTLK